MDETIQNLLDQMPAGRDAGKYIQRLTPDSVRVLDEFAEWLSSYEGKAASTSAAYRGYVAQALCHIEDGGEVKDLSTDIKSALNALRRFHDYVLENTDVDETPAETFPGDTEG